MRINSLTRTSSFSILRRHLGAATTSSFLPATTCFIRQSGGSGHNETNNSLWRVGAALAGAFSMASLGLNFRNSTDCCGIAGVVASDQHDAR
jgi:hypothetical protein